MSLRGLLRQAALAAGILLASSSEGQENTPPPTPAAAAQPAVTPGAGMAPLRLTDQPAMRIDRLPAENPFGIAAETPAALPLKPAFTEQTVDSSLFAAVRVDKTGHVTASERVRDPIPSLAADSKKSFERWSFEPARKDGRPVDSWASVRVEMTATVRPPKVEQIALKPVLPSSPIPAPLEWAPDQAWYDSAPAGRAPDGTVAIEQADTMAVPKKTKWDADSYKGPFSIRMWIHIDAAGHAGRMIPIQASDPILISYFRKQISTWTLKPATVKGQPVESWAELSMSGTIGWSAEVKQIANLRKTLTGSAAAQR
ncbi:MAG TPA: hypothetical protein VE007_05115 [Thermoanaerobaculia bacterium]|nr:hypothetical protein [Thermoanaerobaculia bacterium]